MGWRKSRTRAGVVGVFLSDISTAGTTIYLRISIYTPTEVYSSFSNHPGLFGGSLVINKKQITDRGKDPHQHFGADNDMQLAIVNGPTASCYQVRPEIE
jgi:hypothetical protein